MTCEHVAQTNQVTTLVVHQPADADVAKATLDQRLAMAVPPDVPIPVVYTRAGAVAIRAGLVSLGEPEMVASLDLALALLTPAELATAEVTVASAKVPRGSAVGRCVICDGHGAPTLIGKSLSDA